jgi:hypothetical protein
MTENPYQGTELENAWLQGYQDGANEPTVSHQPPEEFSSEQLTVFLEGEAAGQTDANAGQPIAVPEITIEGDAKANAPPIVNAPLPDEPQKEPEQTETHKADAATLVTLAASGYTAYKIFALAKNLYKKGQTIVRVLGSIGIEANVAELAMLSIPVLVILESDPPAPTDNRSAMNKWLAARCADRGCTDLYLPLSRRSDPATIGPWKDTLSAGGYWHGRLYTDDLARAVDEAAVYVALNPRMDGGVGVLHFQAAVPDELEFCPISIEMSADQSSSPQ